MSRNETQSNDRRRTNIGVHDVFVLVIVHLRLHEHSQCTQSLRLNVLRTSCDKVELPHPSIRILADFSGMSSRMMSAMSLYDLNQSKEASSDSLNE